MTWHTLQDRGGKSRNVYFCIKHQTTGISRRRPGGIQRRISFVVMTQPLQYKKKQKNNQLLVITTGEQKRGAATYSIEVEDRHCTRAIIAHYIRLELLERVGGVYEHIQGSVMGPPEASPRTEPSCADTAYTVPKALTGEGVNRPKTESVKGNSCYTLLRPLGPHTEALLPATAEDEEHHWPEAGHTCLGESIRPFLQHTKDFRGKTHQQGDPCRTLLRPLRQHTGALLTIAAEDEDHSWSGKDEHTEGGQTFIRPITQQQKVLRVPGENRRHHGEEGYKQTNRHSLWESDTDTGDEHINNNSKNKTTSHEEYNKAAIRTQLDNDDEGELYVIPFSIWRFSPPSNIQCRRERTEPSYETRTYKTGHTTKERHYTQNSSDAHTTHTVQVVEGNTRDTHTTNREVHETQ
jgi:hypothetical protein